MMNPVEETNPANGEVAKSAGNAATRTVATEVDREDATATHAATGSLRLTIVWGKDGSPAPGIPVSLRRRGVDTLLAAPRGVTDENGVFVFEGLAPGPVSPLHEQGLGRTGKRVEIVAGETRQATLEIRAGMTIKGRVVDEQHRAIAAADLVLRIAHEVGSRVVGKSADDGTFVLREMPVQAGIGARKPGYEPTDLRMCNGGVGATVDLTIAMQSGGGSLRGVVLDPHGQPVARAAVRTGTPNKPGHLLPDGTAAFGPAAEMTFTDERGRFAFASLPSGDQPLAVRTPQHAPWFRVVNVVARQVNEVAVHLLPGATLVGTVRFEDDSPAADVPVQAGDYDRFAYRRTRAAQDGTYRLTGLAAGAIKAAAGDLESSITRADLELVVGEQFRWDPVLIRSAKLRGRVLRGDQPVAGLQIVAMLDPWQRGDSWQGFAKTDADGRFELVNIPADRGLEIKVHSKRRFVEAKLHEVLPGPEELVIRLPDERWGRVIGTVLGPDSEVLQEARIRGHLSDVNLGSFRPSVDLDTGAFESAPCPPGSYRMSITAPGFPKLRFTHELAAGETWDVGTVRLQRGSNVAVQLVGDPELFAGRMPMSVYQAGQYIARVETKDGFGRSTPLLAGDYELRVFGGAIARKGIPFTIRVGADTRMDVPIAAGTATTIACTFAGEAPTRPPWASVEVRDASGTVVFRDSLYRHSEWQEVLRLAPGHYTVSMEHNDLRGKAEFDVGGEARSISVPLSR